MRYCISQTVGNNSNSLKCTQLLDTNTYFGTEVSLVPALGVVFLSDVLLVSLKACLLLDSTYGLAKRAVDEKTDRLQDKLHVHSR